MTKIRATFSLDSETLKRLNEMAKRDNRNKSNKLEVLINEAYEAKEYKLPGHDSVMESLDNLTIKNKQGGK